MLAKALADGLSLQGTGEALSIGAAGLFMRSLTGNPMDVHLHTGANLRRYLLKLEGVSLRNKLLALLTWHTGPAVLSTQNRMDPPPQPNPEAVAALPHRTQAALLDALEESIYTQPPTDWSKVTNLGQMRAAPEVKNTVNLAQQYADLGYDPDTLISRLARIVVHDNFTGLHASKHQPATFEHPHPRPLRLPPAAVTGLTDSRAIRTSGKSRKAASVLISASVTGLGSFVTGATSTAKYFPLVSSGSG